MPEDEDEDEGANAKGGMSSEELDAFISSDLG